MDKRQLESSKDLIAEISQRAEGIGEHKASAIAEDFLGELQDFLAADSIRLAKLVSTSGQRLLNEQQVQALLRQTIPFPKNLGLPESWAYLIGREFLMSQINHLQELTLASLDINPFLVKVLALRTPRQILEFNLYQNVTRSVVTAWGSAVEKLLISCGASPYKGSSGGRSGRKPDLHIEKDGQEYFIQVKSGPNTMNLDMVNSLNELIDEYRVRMPDAKVLLGMTYGRRERVSTQIRHLHDYPNSALIGRELWDFVSGENGFYRKVLSILDQESAGITQLTFSQVLELKLKEMERDWTSFYPEVNIGEALERHM